MSETQVTPRKSKRLEEKKEREEIEKIQTPLKEIKETKTMGKDPSPKKIEKEKKIGNPIENEPKKKSAIPRIENVMKESIEGSSTENVVEKPLNEGMVIKIINEGKDSNEKIAINEVKEFFNYRSNYMWLSEKLIETFKNIETEEEFYIF